MAHYEKFDDEVSTTPKFTIVTRSSGEKVDLFITSDPSLTNEAEITKRHALITLNIISIVVSAVCGIITFFLAVEERSASALGFATDTILDVLAFAAIIWRFTSTDNPARREIYVLKILAILFFLSGFGVFIDSLLDIHNQIHPIPNHYLAIAVAIQTLIFFCLAYGKYTVAKKLHAISAYSDAFNTFISALMALSVVVSIMIYNSNGNVWYIDPMIGMIISITIMIYGLWMMRKALKKI